MKKTVKRSTVKKGIEKTRKKKAVADRLYSKQLAKALKTVRRAAAAVDTYAEALKELRLVPMWDEDGPVMNSEEWSMFMLNSFDSVNDTSRMLSAHITAYSFRHNWFRGSREVEDAPVTPVTPVIE